MSFTFVQTAYADMGEAAGKLIGKINKIIINPLIVLVFAIALVVFLYGLYEMLANGESEEERTKGKQHMLWGVIGMFIMVSVFTIMQLVIDTIGIDYINNPRGGEVNIK